jgi:hypothetical protein
MKCPIDRYLILEMVTCSYPLVVESKSVRSREKYFCLETLYNYINSIHVTICMLNEHMNHTNKTSCILPFIVTGV